jgi:hypothetical protein
MRRPTGLVKRVRQLRRIGFFNGFRRRIRSARHWSDQWIASKKSIGGRRETQSAWLQVGQWRSMSDARQDKPTHPSQMTHQAQAIPLTATTPPRGTATELKIVLAALSSALLALKTAIICAI